MSDKEKVTQLKEEVEKVSGGVPDFMGEAGGQSGNNPANDLLKTFKERNNEIKDEVIL